MMGVLNKSGKNWRKDVSPECTLSFKGEMVNIDKCIEMSNLMDALDNFSETSNQSSL